MIQAIESNQYSDRNLSVFADNMMLPRHRWYEFKEGFSELLVREAILSADIGKRKINILDPFAGSGTTLVTAGRLGHRAIGVEVNPFLAFASRAKCVQGRWSRSTFECRLEDILRQGKHEVASAVEGVSTFCERNGNEKWLFNRSVLRGFSGLDRAVERAGHYRLPLRLALFGGLMDCCNAKRDGKCLRYRKGWEKAGANSGDLRLRFEARAKDVAEDILGQEFHAGGIRILAGDSRKVLQSLETRSVDLVITSPPYLNSFDYSDVYRPELFVGGYVADNADLRRIRLQTIRSHVQVAWPDEERLCSKMLSPIIEQLSALSLWSARIPMMVQAYFADMSNVLTQCARCTRKGGQAWIVVSTSAYGTIEIPVDLILADVAAQSGWSLEGVYVLRQLRSAGQQWKHVAAEKAKPLRESLIVLKK